MARFSCALLVLLVAYTASVEGYYYCPSYFPITLPPGGSSVYSLLSYCPWQARTFTAPTGWNVRFSCSQFHAPFGLYFNGAPQNFISGYAFNPITSTGNFLSTQSAYNYGCPICYFPCYWCQNVFSCTATAVQNPTCTRSINIGSGSTENIIDNPLCRPNGVTNTITCTTAGQFVTLTCGAYNSPSPNCVTLQYNGNTVTRCGTSFQTINTMAQSVTWTENAGNTNDYSCTASCPCTKTTNIASGASQTFVDDVACRAAGSTNTISCTTAGQTVSLSCTAYNSPAPNCVSLMYGGNTQQRCGNTFTAFDTNQQTVTWTDPAGNTNDYSCTGSCACTRTINIAEGGTAAILPITACRPGGLKTTITCATATAPNPQHVLTLSCTAFNAPNPQCVQLTAGGTNVNRCGNTFTTVNTGVQSTTWLDPAGNTNTYSCTGSCAAPPGK